LHHSSGLARDVEKKGAMLTLRRGRADESVLDLVREAGASAVFWNRCYEPHAIARDKALKEKLIAKGVEATSGNALMNGRGRSRPRPAIRVHAAGARVAAGGARRNACAKEDRRLEKPLASDKLADWQLLPSHPVREFWPRLTPGAGRQARSSVH
jgi:deoxyribodipyrimidine photo-lyase